MEILRKHKVDLVSQIVAECTINQFFLDISRERPAADGNKA